MSNFNVYVQSHMTESLSVLGELRFSFLPHGKYDILIIANRGVSVNSIIIPEIKAIFLKQKAHWKGGGRVVAANAKENTPLRAAFQKILLGMSAAKEKNYWQDQKIRTELSAPPRGSVSYVLRKDYRQGVVKILLVLPQVKKD